MNRWIIPIVMVLLLAIGSTACTKNLADNEPAADKTGEKDNPIHITFVIHFDPLPNLRGQVLRQAYEQERDNLQWLADYLEQLEAEKGKEFVPRLTLEIAGDHAEWYIEDEKGLDLLQRLYQKGIHSFGTHFHTNYKAGKHYWVNATPSPENNRRVTQDHIAEVDKLISRVVGTDNPVVIREVNRTITGHLLDLGVAEQMGFDVFTGGRNETMNLFFDHDVYNPWRPAQGWNLAEDISSHWLLIPQAPVLGSIGEHAPLPPGISEEYTRGMRNMIWQDISVPAMERKFLHLYLEWRNSSLPEPGSMKVWVFGWHEHTGDLFPDDALGRGHKMRGAVTEFVDWLNTNFIGKKTSDGNLIAEYANTDEVRNDFLLWEKSHPGQSSFNYPLRVRDWDNYPYQLKGLARELMYAHYEQEVMLFRDKGVHIHKLLKTEGRNWEVRGGKVVSTGATKDIYVLWADKGEVVTDLSGFIGGKVRRVEGKSGTESVVDGKKLTVPEEPIIIETIAQHTTAGSDGRALIQFRMNINYIADTAEAQQNYRILRRHLELFKQAGVKASYWFTGLAAEQALQLDPEFIRLLEEAGMPVAHHGANRPPKPMPIDRVKGESWEMDVQAILDYESSAIDPRTGELDKTEIGGLKRMQQIFNNRIQATGRFFQASILYAAKQFGCRMMVGLKGNTGAGTNAGWFLGMMGIPDSLSIGPEMLREAANGRLDLSRLIEDFVAQQSSEQVQSLAVVIHDTDFLRGPSDTRESLWKTYESLVTWAAKHPQLNVVTFEELLGRIADDRTKTVSREALLKAAGIVGASTAAPPEYIALDGDYLSLADTFQAFMKALLAFTETGELPQSVGVADLLGPTETFQSHLPSTTDGQALPSVNSEEVIGAAKEVCARMTDRIPSWIGVGSLETNPAEFLYAMAQTITAIAKTGKPALIPLHALDALPNNVRQNSLADPLTRLQFWTFKPERWTITVAK
ncbi:MAG: hypothetical protein AB1597_03565 [Chloroflexota bacterium]